MAKRIGTARQLHSQLKKSLQKAISVEDVARVREKIIKANQKGARLRRQQNALFNIRYVKSLSYIRTADDFERLNASLDFTLSRNYTRKKNEQSRQQIYKNLENSFGEKSKYVIMRLKTMSNRTLAAFMEQNADLELIFFDSENSGVVYQLDMTIEKINRRIDVFLVDAVLEKYRGD